MYSPIERGPRFRALFSEFQRIEYGKVYKRYADSRELF